MATIPMHIIHSCILPRLPVKSLTRFKSVSKSWQTIISSREFIHVHHHQAISSDANRLLVFMDKALQIFHVHELDSPLQFLSVHWYNPNPTAAAMSILASCEFFLLINLYMYRDLGLVLLNPSTGRYYKIPYPPIHNGNYSYGMYFDEANHDYKVVSIAQSWSSPIIDIREANMKVMVYSLRTNMWKLFERRLNKSFGLITSNKSVVVIRHLLHIIFRPRCWGYDDGKITIGCFDILAEKWTNDVSVPPINDLGLIKLLTVLDGLLCVTTVDREENGSYNWSVWVMKEYGVKDSWFKLMSINSNNNNLSFYPIAYRTGSRHEVLCKQVCNTVYFWYNIREKKAATTTIEGIYGYICKGSLIEFPGGRHMKLHQPKQAEETTRSSENYPCIDGCTLNQFFFSLP